MTDMYEILRDNLVRLRKSRQLTQAELAEILQYSDKSVSKWETGETLPSIETLVNISDFYGIPVDDLLRKQVNTEQVQKVEMIRRANKKAISILSLAAIWLIAVTVFVGAILSGLWEASKAWITFIWAVPVSSLVAIIISMFWQKKHIHIWFSLFTWTLITAIYLTIIVSKGNTDYWMLFLIGIPLQIIIFLVRGLRYDVAKEQLDRQEALKAKMKASRPKEEIKEE